MTAPALVMLALLLAAGLVFLRQKPVALVAFLALGGFPLFFGHPGLALLLSGILLAILLAQPLFVVLTAVTLLCFTYFAEVPLIDWGIFPEKIFELTDKNVLLAIPFFVISGAIMTQGGIAKRLIDFATELTHWLPGGLAIASVAGCVLFGAISGSSPVTVIAIGSMMFPALVKAGFDERLSMGLLTSAGSLGIVIPPSIPMIVYAIVVSGQEIIDVGELFLAGLGPGLLMGTLMAAYIVFQALRASSDRGSELRQMGKGLAIIAAPIVIGELLAFAVGPWGRIVGLVLLLALIAYAGRRAFLDGFWALLLPIVILGGIYGGFFTPTEAAAVAVVYAIVVELFIHRQLKVSDVPEVFAESTILMGALILILVVAFVFNDFIVSEQIPERAVEFIASKNLSQGAFLVALNVFLLLVGCFMDILSAILIIAPLIAPMASALGVDPVHLGIIFIVNLEVGYLTPPLGLNLFVASTLFKKSLGEVVRSVVPFTGLMLAGILLVTYVPVIALGPGLFLDSLAEAEHDEGLSEGHKADDGDGQVKSIEELMQEQSLKGPSDSPDGDGDGSEDEGRVKSIEELMRDAGLDTDTGSDP